MLQLLIIAIIVGAIVYIVQLLPINGTIKQVAVVIAVVILAIYAIRILAPMAGIG